MVPRYEHFADSVVFLSCLIQFLEMSFAIPQVLIQSETHKLKSSKVYERICIACGAVLGEDTSCWKCYLFHSSALLPLPRTGSSIQFGFLWWGTWEQRQRAAYSPTSLYREEYSTGQITQHVVPPAVNALAQAPCWSNQPAPGSLAGSSTLQLHVVPEATANYSQLFLFNLFPSSLFMLHGTKVN